MLLAIDTSAGTSVALVADTGECAAERSSADPRLHAEVIGEFIAGVLSDAHLDRSAITGVVAGMGPGPFTGLRVGIAAAHAFALGSRLPLLRVVSHDAVALAAEAAGAAGPLLVVTDARRREVYWSTYAPGDGTAAPVSSAGPSLCRPDDLEDEVDRASAGVSENPEGRGNRAGGYAHHTRIDAAEVSAAALGRVAAMLLASGARFADEGAIYLRSPDVTVSSGPKRVTG